MSCWSDESRFGGIVSFAIFILIKCCYYWSKLSAIYSLVSFISTYNQTRTCRKIIDNVHNWSKLSAIYSLVSFISTYNQTRTCRKIYIYIYVYIYYWFTIVLLWQVSWKTGVSRSSILVQYLCDLFQNLLTECWVVVHDSRINHTSGSDIWQYQKRWLSARSAQSDID